MDESQYMVVFTGAGISTDSGLPDFRGAPAHLRFHERIGDVLPRAVRRLKRLMGFFEESPLSLKGPHVKAREPR